MAHWLAHISSYQLSRKRKNKGRLLDVPLYLFVGSEIYFKNSVFCFFDRWKMNCATGKLVQEVDIDILHFMADRFQVAFYASFWAYRFQVAEEVSKIAGVKKVLLADNDAFKGFLPGKD